MGVLQPGTSLSYCPGDSYAVLITQPLGQVKNIVMVRIEHHLDQPGVIPQIDKDNSTVISSGVNPAGDFDLLSN